jgi:hypothetical protein
MLTEREKPHSRIITLLIELQGEGEAVYKPILVNENAHDATTHFIIEETGRLKKRLRDLRTIPAKPAKRSKRETRDIRKSREKMISKEQLEEKLSVLKGENLRPIRLISKGDEIKGLELVNFAQEEQKKWWTYLKQKSQMRKIAEVAQVYPDGLELLSEVFSIRCRMKYGLPEEAVQARKELNSFGLKAREIPTRFDRLLIPLFRMITEQFGN